MLIAPVVVGGSGWAIRTITRTTTRNRQLKKEQDLKNLYCYDRSGGHYWKLKRKPTKSEWLTIDQRRANGERWATILDDMKLL